MFVYTGLQLAVFTVFTVGSVYIHPDYTGFENCLETDTPEPIAAVVTVLFSLYDCCWYDA